MKTAVDASVLLNLFSADELMAESSDLALQESAKLGDLIVCELVLAELGPALGGQSAGEFLRDWQLQFVPATLEVVDLAARHFTRYLQRGGKRGRVVADFLIGAHAAILADGRSLRRMRDFAATISLVCCSSVLKSARSEAVKAPAAP